MVIKDKVAAAVYVDVVGDVANFDTDAIELLVFTTGLLVDTLAIRKKIPSPSLSRADGAAATTSAPASGPAAPAPQAAAPAPAPRPAAPPAAPTPAPAPAPRPAPPAAAPEPAEQPIPRRTDAGTVAINATQLREMMANQRPGFNVPSADEFSTPKPAAPAPAPAAAAPAAPAVGGDERPTTQYIPPANINRANILGGEKSEDAKKHDEARRFARLLVSEIKLYNETKVDQGRRNNDLYERLKEDIDRSRQMYDERIADEVRKVSNYFYDELVRILADGRADALGL
jgi:hypothetical protein